MGVGSSLRNSGGPRPIRVMFVCLGNICRSPLAQAVFEKEIARAESAGMAGAAGMVEADSSGTTAYHAGAPSDPRMRQTAGRHGVTINHRAQAFSEHDFENFDYILAMDRENYRDLQGMARSEEERRRIHYFREWDPEDGGPGKEVPDPYYGGPEGFERVYELVDRTAGALLEDILK